MGSLAQLAKALGYTVTGCDKHVYPPMSTQLEAAGIELIQGYEPDQLALNPDVFVIGNVISRGNPLIEAILNRGLPYVSGPQWLAEHVLKDRWVLAVAGTHGKTTTATMLTWILEQAGYRPGYLIGGVPQNFPTSARLGESDFFVVEADEYDTAFFDKRSKFVHYRPRTLIMNNLEFDHADIFPDLAAIQTQFHHLVRTVPGEGLVIHPGGDQALEQVVAKGCWTPRQTLGAQWAAQSGSEDGARFEVFFEGNRVGEVSWSLTGQHNVNNALAAIAAARHVGVDPGHSCAALSEFAGVKRRMEIVGEVNGITVYDDFAHHPTAIKTTLAGLRARVGPGVRITAIIEPRSNTMKEGVLKERLFTASEDADTTYWLEPSGLKWSFREIAGVLPDNHRVCDSTGDIVTEVVGAVGQGEQIVVMSNGSFQGIHRELVEALQNRAS